MRLRALGKRLQLQCRSFCHILYPNDGTNIDKNVRFLWGAFRIRPSHLDPLPQTHSVMYARSAQSRGQIASRLNGEFIELGHSALERWYPTIRERR